MPLKQVEILGVNVNSLTMVQAVEKVQQFIDERKNALVATANAEMLMRATQDEELKHILNSADLVVPDGAGTVWAANYLGVEMPERVAGYDLAQELMREAPGRGDRIYFFGSAPGVAESAREKAMELYPGIKIVGTRNGFFSEADEPEIIAEIKAARPDILLVALGKMAVQIPPGAAGSCSHWCRRHSGCYGRCDAESTTLDAEGQAGMAFPWLEAA